MQPQGTRFCFVIEENGPYLVRVAVSMLNELHTACGERGDNFSSFWIRCEQTCHLES